MDDQMIQQHTDKLKTGDTDEERLSTIRALAKSKDKRAIELLMDIMQHESDIPLRTMTIKVLSSVAHRLHHKMESSILDILIDIIQGDEPEAIKLEAITSIKNFSRRQRVHDVLRPIADEDSAFSEAAKSSLRSAGYSIELENEKCVVCDLTQKQVQLYHCHVCGKPVCRNDSFPKDSFAKPPAIICSSECFSKSGIPSNPQYW